MKSRQDFESEIKYKEYIRTHFAALAMQGLSSIRIGSGANQEAVIECDAKAAVQYADALLSELEKTETP